MKKVIILIGILLSIGFMTSSFIDGKNNKTEIVIDSVLTEQNVYTSLIFFNIKYPEVVMSQIMIESNKFNSKLCKNNNNLFGMTIATKRITTAINKSGYAKYNNWVESVLDYKYYQDYILCHHKIENRTQYIAFLHKNYAHSKTYKDSLTRLSLFYDLKNKLNAQI